MSIVHQFRDQNNFARISKHSLRPESRSRVREFETKVYWARRDLAIRGQNKLTKFFGRTKLAQNMFSLFFYLNTPCRLQSTLALGVTLRIEVLEEQQGETLP